MDIVEEGRKRQQVNYKHAVSELLVGNMNRFERKEITKQQLFTLVDALADIAVDERQRAFFEAYKELTNKVEGAIANFTLDSN